MKKRILCIVLVLAMLAGIVSAAKVDSYKDVPKDAWYYEWVSQALEKGYFKGYSDTVFAPGDTMTRAMMVTVLYRLSGARNTSKEMKFSDVPANEWYTDAIIWAEEKGIVNGIGHGKFDPMSPVQREQMAAIIGRYITYMENNYNVTYSHLKTGTVKTFADAAKISDWAKSCVDQCQSYGILDGFPAAAGKTQGEFKPRESTTRAQAAKVIAKLAYLIENGRSKWSGGGGYIPSVPHTHSWTWGYNTAEHWQSCSCGQTQNKGPHSYVNGVCVCGRHEDPAPHVHSWSTDWTKDATHHWHTCSGCTEKNDYAAHVYTNGVCVCGAQEPHTHSWTWTYNDAEHWQVCSCTETQNRGAHAYTNGVCVCGRNEDPPAHTHDWAAAWTSDATHHWHTCSGCTEKNDYAPHSYVGGKCVCGMQEYYVTYQAYDPASGWFAFDQFTYTDEDFANGITVEDFTTVPADYTEGGVVYTFKGWAVSPNNSTGEGQLAAGDAVTNFDSANTETLYAVYAATDDYVYMAVEAAVADMQALAQALNNKRVNVKGYEASLGTFDAAVTVGNLSYSASVAHSVDISVEGALGADLVDRMLEIATTYAVAILGPDSLPTKTEIKDVVVDVAGDLNVPVTETSAKAIAASVYDKLHDNAVDVWANFQNFGGKFCISSIDIEDGKLVLTVNDEQGLVSLGTKKESLKACKTLALGVARELYASLVAAGGSTVENGMNVTTLTSTITVNFDQAAGVPVYPAAYDFDLTAKFTSDMVAYSWDANAGIATVTLTLTERLQEQYAESLEQVLQATLQNGTAQEKLTSVIDKVVSSSPMVAELKVLAGEDAVNKAIDQWIADNLAVTGTAKAYSPYEFLWTNEGVLTESSGVYSTGSSKIVGVNDALYALLDAQYGATVDSMIAALDSSTIKSSSMVQALQNAMGSSYDVAAKADEAFTAWKADNTGSATGSAGVYTPAEFLAQGGKVVKTGDTYSLSTGGILGVNDELYAFIVETFEALADQLAPTVLAEAKANVADYIWTGASPEQRRFLLKAGVGTELDKSKYSALSQENKDYLTNLIIVEAGALDSSLGDTSAEAAAAASQAPSLNTLIDQMLMKTVYDKVATNSSYEQFYGKTVEDLKADIDQTVMKTLATAEVKGKSLNQYMAIAVRFKTVDGLRTATFTKVAGMMRNDTFQKVVSRKGNAYVEYLAKVISRIPAGAEVSIAGSVLNKVAIEDVQKAAKAGSTAAVCEALADVLSDTGLANLSMDSFASGRMIQVKYNDRTFGFLLQVEIP